MRLQQQLSVALVVSGLAVLGVGGATALAVAQTAAAPAGQPARSHHSHIDGRIAYLRAELKITDAQQAQWDKVAATMRENGQTMHQAFETMRAAHGTSPNAVQHLETAAQFAALRVQADQRFLDAFKPLYASFSDEQKATADELFQRHRHAHRR
jgi:protein CpxP